ncbi:hypothetical protein Fmac_007803 [Flemingia macrophylla]|uniref:FAF domain-containing protein n=1 Tax=Flemingia macrophylla TaxID=520843 RepID=A0ABD1MVL9_9FABA
MNGVYIGSESCIDLENENDIVLHHCHTSKTNNNVVGSRRKEKREFPPPIPHCRCVFRRHCTTDGRLILKMNHHHYFRAHRANGRLMLHLQEEETTHQTSNTIGSTKDKTRILHMGAVGGINGGSPSKFLNCNRAISTPLCVFGLPLHPLRTVLG